MLLTLLLLLSLCPFCAKAIWDCPKRPEGSRYSAVTLYDAPKEAQAA